MSVRTITEIPLPRYNINTMNSQPSLFQRLRNFALQKDQPEDNFEKPFFVLLTLIFIFIYVWSIIATPTLREPVRLILFTVLMILHTVLYWLVPRFQHGNWLAGYLVVQGTLAFIIVFLAWNLAPIFGLYLGLIGETIGLLKKKPGWMAVAVTAYLALSLINYGVIIGWATWFRWFIAVGPMTIFVFVYVILYARQSEARAQAQTLLKQLESANRQLTEYASRVEDLTIANERQRMARELHDTLSQGLAGLILQLEAVDAHLASQRPERARTILQQSMEKARGTLAEARQAIDNLRQPVELNLVEVIQGEAEHFSNSTGIACKPQIDLAIDVPEAVAEAAGRAVSESLTNIARHARAKNVTLHLSGKNKELEIEICDDGRGFDPEAVQAGHYGLLGMRERVRLAGGSLEVQSAPSNGTCVRIHFPLGEISP